ncbi:hypothetical protein [Polynucleobacter sp. Fuers-14]|uniref:hypothetical protein n=1 Tax=Polynucleobacter sp. Fuers-14 TaxID=1758364 RepID=UPI001C0B4498|nr:hypothetical protein [Polynucleobacter sp. Fuers-14]MBU3640825.1 hypothetical protein [Polynucleobacter sp. Fuers-14]
MKKSENTKISPNASVKAIRAGEQAELFDAYSFSPLEPNPSSKEGEVLKFLRGGKVLTQPMFLKMGGSWRLAAIIFDLITKYRWPITNLEPRSKPAKYKLEAWAHKSLEANHG